MCKTINILSLSGGKDSTAMALLAIERETENIQAVFADTGNEHPFTYEYVCYLEDHLGIPIRWVKADFSEKLQAKGIDPTGIPFLDLCLWKTRFPSSQCRFCTTTLKRDVIKAKVFDPILDSGNDIESWQGIRWDESRSRACYKERDLAYSDKDTGAEVWNYRPILSWSAMDTFEIMKKHGVKPNPLYSLGMNRVGCMPCVMSRKREIAEIAARFPEQIDRIEQWEKEVALVSKRKSASFFPWDESQQTHGIRDVVRWSKTDRGGRQYGLYDDWENLPSCSSNYGLCEL